ncbi:MAG TPA: PLP-dependent aminotransferase family protein [Pyrinomonadaceae bacterium]|jgi:GntR family transcriptional regulator/MocR family aminotransferase
MPHPPFIILDVKSKVPLYRQIYETIRRSILTGEFYSGKQLPASRHLAKQLGVSRMTVLNAFDQLLAEGYLEGKTGAGTFVARHLPEEFLQTAPVKGQKSGGKISDRQLILSRYGKNILRENRTILQSNQTTPPVPFQHGLPAIDQFPFDVWTKIANKKYRTLEREAFGYGQPSGFTHLREAISAHLKSVRGVVCAPEQVIITGGAQQALDLIGRIFIEPRSKVLIENPGYFGAKQILQTFDAKFVPVPVDEEGFNLNAVLRQSRNARLAYVTPSHQFPLGATMSLARRLNLLEWAKKNDCWIVEDDYDSEFRYEGRPLPSLQGLDRDGRVLYIGTFSKTLFPALRLGCVVVPPDLIETFTAARSLSGSQSPLIDQATLAEFIAEGHFGRHIRRMRRLYEERQGILVSEIEKHLAGKLDVKNSTSGMHVIGWLPDGVDDKYIAKQAALSGIKTAALSAHSLTKWQRGGLILGYTAVNEKQIKNGVKQLTKVLENSF